MKVWLCRIPYCRGFCVQSPSDYAFVRYVINEHWNYYAYHDFTFSFPMISRNRMKLGKLYFRVANFFQPKTVVDFCPKEITFPTFIQAGCHRVRFAQTDTRCSAFDLARVCLSMSNPDELDDIIRHACSDSVLLVEGIYDSPSTRKLWQMLLDSERTRITFDLYDVGIVLFDEKRYKHHYIINF